MENDKVSSPSALAAWVFSGDSGSVDAYIEEAVAKIQAVDLHAVVRQSCQVYSKIYAAREAGMTELKEQAQSIMQILQAASRSGVADPLPAHLIEGTLAIQYLIDEQDLIADTASHIGLVDDAILIARVFRRNQLQLRGASFSYS